MLTFWQNGDSITTTQCVLVKFGMLNDTQSCKSDKTHIPDKTQHKHTHKTTQNHTTQKQPLWHVYVPYRQNKNRNVHRQKLFNRTPQLMYVPLTDQVRERSFLGSLWYKREFSWIPLYCTTKTSKNHCPHLQPKLHTQAVVWPRGITELITFKDLKEKWHSSLYWDRYIYWPTRSILHSYCRWLVSPSPRNTQTYICCAPIGLL